MFRPQFFNSQAWHRILVNFAKLKGVPAPVVEIQCIDGTSFRVAWVRPWKSCLLVGVYGEEEKTTVRFLPYEHIKYIDLKEEAEKLQIKEKPPLGFRVPEKEEKEK